MHNAERFRIHESSHAMMALACGLKFTCLMSFGDAGMVLLENLTPAKIKNPDFRKRYLLATCAGVCGEGIRFEDNFLASFCAGMGQSDLKNLEKMGFTLPEILDGCEAATDYLSANWQAVQALEACLRRFPMMFAEDVKNACGNLPDPFAVAVVADRPDEQSFRDKREFLKFAQKFSHIAPPGNWLASESQMVRAAY